MSDVNQDLFSYSETKKPKRKSRVGMVYRKLSKRQKKDIINDYMNGMTFSQMAAKHGYVGNGTLSYIIDRHKKKSKNVVRRVAQPVVVSTYVPETTNTSSDGWISKVRKFIQRIFMVEYK